MSNTADCCEGAPFSKDLIKQTKGKKGFRMFQDIPNPIPAEIKDPKEIEDTFKNYPFIPYARTDHNSNYGLLIWLNSMRHLSPTHGACINSIRSYALGLPLDVIKPINSDFIIKDEITEAQKITFITWLTEIFKLEYGDTLKTIANLNYYNLKDNGNAFVEVKMSNFLGLPSINVVAHATETVCYVKPSITSPHRYVGISHRWDASSIKTDPPRILPVYPAVVIEDDYVSTVIHVKQPSSGLYGRPDWLSSFMSVYREFQDANYLIKQTANNFMGQALIEIEEAQINDGSILDDKDAQNSGFDNAAHRFSENFSVKSDDPQSVILMSRPFGAREAFVFQFKPNTSENFYKVMSELEEIDIIRAHQWSKRFLGENQTQGFSKDVFIDELKVKEVAVLPDIREMACKPLNIIVQMAVEYFNRPEFARYQITGTSNIDVLKTMIPPEEMKPLDQNNELQDNPNQ